MKHRLNLPKLTDILLAALGVAFCGFGVGLSNGSALGFDPIGVFYDGLRATFNISPSFLGMVSIGINALLIIFLLFVSRKYVSFGTIIYLAGYGLFVDLGTLVYNLTIHEPSLVLRIILTTIGCLMLYIGLGIYVAIDIGVDPFTGVVLWLSDLTHKKLKIVKMVFDICIFIIGALLHGTLGIVTIVCAFVGGPLIQMVSENVMKLYFRFSIKDIKKGTHH